VDGRVVCDNHNSVLDLSKFLFFNENFISVHKCVISIALYIFRMSLRDEKTNEILSNDYVLFAISHISFFSPSN
jgi:hypothetical protein